MPIDFQPIDFQLAGQKENPSGYLMNLYNQWVRPTVGMTGALGPRQQIQNIGGAVSNALEGYAQVGRAGNQANQQMSDFSAEQLGKAGINPYVAAIPGTVLGTLSQANPFLPQNKLSAALSLIGMKGQRLPFTRTPVNQMPTNIPASLIPQTSEIPVSGEKLAAITQLARQAGNEGVKPSTIMTDAEYALYSKYKTSIDNAVQHNFPISALEQNPMQSITSMAEPPLRMEQAGTKVIQPGPISNTVGATTSATTAIPQRYTAGVAADTSILDTSKTPGLKEVGQRYVDYFKKIGAIFNEPLFKKWSGKDYFPGDSEIGRIETTIADLKGALQEGQALKPEELFMGRSAASTALRSNKAAINPAFKTWAQNAQNQFDQALEEQGHGELKELGRQWFRAKAQDAFTSLLPLNKNMSPNALRSNLLLNELLKTITGPFQGGFMKQSIPSAARVVAMSPYLAGKTLQYGDKFLQGAGQAVGNQMTPFVGSMLSNALSGNQPR